MRLRVGVRAAARPGRAGWAVSPVTVAAVAAVALAGLAGCGGGPGETSAQALGRLVAAWNQGRWSAMAAVVDHPAPGFATAVPALTAGLDSTSSTHRAGPVREKGATARATITSRYVVGGVHPWTVTAPVGLVRRGSHWLVRWSPSVVAPGLGPGDRLSAAFSWASRAPVLGAGGVPLTSEQKVVEVGVEGSRIADAAAVSATLRGAGATAAEVSSALKAAAAHPSYFEPVFRLTEQQYAQLGGKASQLYRIAGTVFRTTDARTAVTPGLAAHVVGSVGPITAEQLRALGPPYTSTSTVGQTGIEGADERRLAGTPGVTIAVVGPKGGTITTLATTVPIPGTAVQTTIDPTVQAAAERALAGVGHDAALVAIRASTGGVLAAASVPTSSAFDAALEGAYPPGSTFKIVTAAALFQVGLAPSSPASCPPTVTVDGAVFHNAGGEAPTSTVQGAFTESCNTAFIQLATGHLTPSSLTRTAAQLGLGAPVDLGLPAFAGRVPSPADGASFAAAAIGQDKVLVSPLAMAALAATIDSGGVRSPRLVETAVPPAARPLPPGLVADLRPMMAAVVTSGTAAGTGLPPGTFAKTGTAQYGSGTGLATDAWLVGYHGDTAFAVVVQGGGNGGPTCGPIVARFFAALGT